MSKVEMTPEEMEAREQEEFNTGPLRCEIQLNILFSVFITAEVIGSLEKTVYAKSFS